MYLKGLGKIMQMSKGIRPVGGYLNLIRYKAFFDIFYCVPEHGSFIMQKAYFQSDIT